MVIADGISQCCRQFWKAAYYDRLSHRKLSAKIKILLENFFRITSMKALSKLKPEKGLWLVDVPVPTCGYGQVLIKIKKTAICGSDLHSYHWDAWAQKTIPVPLVLGHEFMGEIVEVGEGVKQFKMGDRVSGEGHITCGYCRNCRAGNRHLCRDTKGIGAQIAGAFAEYLCMPAENVYKLPDDISDVLGSIL